MWINRIKELPPIRFLRLSAISAEARLFDWRHNVQTRADKSERLRDWTTAFPYLPIRPNTARRVIHMLPIGDPSDYTFVDIGSGKGRMLLIAAEFPFRRIVGVEIRDDLHHQAVENVRRFRHPRAYISRIDCVQADATRYDFPAGKLVVYLFNPFSPQVMTKVLERLDESYEQDPREIVLVYVYPQFGSLLKNLRCFQICQETDRYCVAKSQFTDAARQTAANNTCAG
jgi:SAM-dependent methyltransferase